MTDNEIKKALEHSAEWLEKHGRNTNTGIAVICRQALYLINRQQAENEKLKNENEILSKNADTAFQDGLNEAQNLYAEQIKAEIKAEAIKEFAERLKKIYIKDKRYDRPNAHTLIDWLFANIDNLVKEMLGENNV